MRSDSVKNMSAYADQNHAPSLTDVRLELFAQKEVKIKQYVAKRDLIVGRLMVMSGNHFILSVNCFLEVAFCEGFPFPVSQAPSN